MRKTDSPRLSCLTLMKVSLMSHLLKGVKGLNLRRYVCSLFTSSCAHYVFEFQFQVASVTPLSSQLPPRRRRYPASSMPQPSQPRPLPMSANSQDRRFITDNALVPRSQQPMVRLPSPGLSGEEGDEDEDLRSSSVTPPPSTPPSSPPPQSQTTWTALWHTEGFDMSNPRLADLRPSYQAVTAYGCEVLKVLIATKNTFPNDIEANALIREAFYPAC